MNLGQARAAMSRYAFCGLSREHLRELVTELAPQWEARCESGRRQRRRGDRRRQAGAGPKYAWVFTGRLLVTLVHLRTGLTHEALGVIYQVGSSTIGRAICEIGPLLAERGFAVPNDQALCLRALAGVFACAEAENVTLRIDGTETGSAGRRPDAPGGPPSSPASASRTRSRPPPSATAKDAPSGNRSRYLCSRLHLRLPGKGLAHLFSLWLPWIPIATDVLQLRQSVPARDTNDQSLRRRLVA